MSKALKVGGVSVQFYTTPGETVCDTGRFVPLHVFHTWSKRRICGSVSTCSDLDYYQVRIQASAN